MLLSPPSLMLMRLAFVAAERTGKRTARRVTALLPALDSMEITTMAIRIAETAAAPDSDGIPVPRLKRQWAGYISQPDQPEDNYASSTDSMIGSGVRDRV